VLGLRVFACDRCDTVFAFPEDVSQCSACKEGSLDELTQTMAHDAYFAPVSDSGR
jgi:hypothetical protein